MVYWRMWIYFSNSLFILYVINQEKECVWNEEWKKKRVKEDWWKKCERNVQGGVTHNMKTNNKKLKIL